MGTAKKITKGLYEQKGKQETFFNHKDEIHYQYHQTWKPEFTAKQQKHIQRGKQII